jgi:hypothetical protein
MRHPGVGLGDGAGAGGWEALQRTCRHPQTVENTCAHSPPPHPHLSRAAPFGLHQGLHGLHTGLQLRSLGVLGLQGSQQWVHGGRADGHSSRDGGDGRADQSKRPCHRRRGGDVGGGAQAAGGWQAPPTHGPQREWRAGQVVRGGMGDGRGSMGCWGQGGLGDPVVGPTSTAQAHRRQEVEVPRGLQAVLKQGSLLLLRLLQQKQAVPLLAQDLEEQQALVQQLPLVLP